MAHPGDNLGWFSGDFQLVVLVAVIALARTYDAAFRTLQPVSRIATVLDIVNFYFPPRDNLLCVQGQCYFPNLLRVS